MLYMILCHDKPGSLKLRMSVRPAHLEYIAAAGERLKLAGPILSAGDEGSPIGSMIIMDAASDGAAMLLADNDPYNKAGLFERVDIHPWKGALGTWLPKDA